MLGTFAQGDKEVTFGPWQPRLEPASKRASTAMKTMETLIDYVSRFQHEEAVQTAWTILQQSLTRCIDFDLRHCPPLAIQELICDVESAARECFAKLLGDTTDRDHESRL